jgi:hypothetical protein
VYALSATPLQGVMMADPNAYNWFHQRNPDAQPGFGLLVYRIKPANPQPGWVAQCSSPTPPLSTRDIIVGFGKDNLRIITFDCRNAWILPGNGAQPGWYVLHKDIINKEDEFIYNSLVDSKLSYHQSEPGRLPAFVIYEKVDKKMPYFESSESIFGEDNLHLLGYLPPAGKLSQDQTYEMVTVWLVNSVPNRPLSLMLHLINTQTGDTLVGDGLGVPVTEWQRGDVLFQRHILQVPQELMSRIYDVSVGVYWLDDLQRWEIKDSVNVEDNAVIMTQIEIK